MRVRIYWNGSVEFTEMVLHCFACSCICPLGQFLGWSWIDFLGQWNMWAGPWLRWLGLNNCFRLKPNPSSFVGLYKALMSLTYGPSSTLTKWEKKKTLMWHLHFNFWGVLSTSGWVSFTGLFHHLPNEELNWALHMAWSTTPPIPPAPFFGSSHDMTHYFLGWIQ